MHLASTVFYTVNLQCGVFFNFIYDSLCLKSIKSWNSVTLLKHFVNIIKLFKHWLLLNNVKTFDQVILYVCRIFLKLYCAIAKIIIYIKSFEAEIHKQITLTSLYIYSKHRHEVVYFIKIQQYKILYLVQISSWYSSVLLGS